MSHYVSNKQSLKVKRLEKYSHLFNSPHQTQQRLEGFQVQERSKSAESEEVKVLENKITARSLQSE